MAVEILLSAVIFALLVFFLVRIFNHVAGTVSLNLSKSKISEELQSAAILMHNEMRLATVRTNTNRFLNMWAGEVSGDVYVYFCAPAIPTNDLKRTQLIHHLCYFWDKASSNVYRAIYEHASNEMTLAYQSPSDPYAWTTQMPSALQQAKNGTPLISRVAYFKALLYTNAPTENSVPLTNQWTDPARLPTFVKFQVGIQENPKKTNSLRNFFISVPMLQEGVNDLNAQ